KGLKRMRLDGSDFVESYEGVAEAIQYVRTQRRPLLLHAKVPLLGHHTSGVRKEWYRTDEDLDQHGKDDPRPKLRKLLVEIGMAEKDLEEIEKDATYKVEQQFKQALESPDPDPQTVEDHIFAPSGATQETGNR